MSTRPEVIIRNLKGVNKVLRTERSEPNLVLALEEVSASLDIAAQELQSLGKLYGELHKEVQGIKGRITSLDNDLGDALLRVEALEAVGGMSPREAKDNLKMLGEIRREDAEK